MADAKGAEMLRDLEGQFDDVTGSFGFDATVTRNAAGELCLPVKLKDATIVTWTRNGATLLGAFKGETRERPMSSPDEAFDETVRFYANLRAR